MLTIAWVTVSDCEISVFLLMNNDIHVYLCFYLAHYWLLVLFFYKKSVFNSFFLPQIMPIFSLVSCSKVLCIFSFLTFDNLINRKHRWSGTPEMDGKCYSAAEQPLQQGEHRAEVVQHERDSRGVTGIHRNYGWQIFHFLSSSSS